MDGTSRSRASCRVAAELLELYLSACAFELLLHSLSVFLRSLLLNSLGSAVNESLSFLQTKTCDLTNSLDNSDLVAACALQDYVKLGLLSSSGSVSSGACNCNSSGR